MKHYCIWDPLCHGFCESCIPVTLVDSELLMQLLLENSYATVQMSDEVIRSTVFEGNVYIIQNGGGRPLDVLL